MQIERSATSISWIPSDSILGPLKFPFEHGVMHYDPPPPLTITDLGGMRRRGEFRFANIVRAWIDVEGGEIRDHGYSGGLRMGLTPVTVGSLRVLLPTKANPEIRQVPVAAGDTVTFVQTAGGRPGFSLLKPSARWPFLVTRPFTIWTTIELTISADGGSTQRLAGASPFPRHWLYDDAGHLVQKAALTRSKLWQSTVFGRHTPWGGQDQVPVLAPPETELERALAEQVMQGGGAPGCPGAARRGVLVPPGGAGNVTGGGPGRYLRSAGGRQGGRAGRARDGGGRARIARSRPAHRRPARPDRGPGRRGSPGTVQRRATQRACPRSPPRGRRSSMTADPV